MAGPELELEQLLGRLEVIFQQCELAGGRGDAMLATVEAAVARCREAVRAAPGWSRGAAGGSSGGAAASSILKSSSTSAGLTAPPVPPLILKTNLEMEDFDGIGDDELSDCDEDIEDEIDIVVEEDGHIIKISPEEMLKLRTEFEENRFLSSSQFRASAAEEENEEESSGKGTVEEVKEENKEEIKDPLETKDALEMEDARYNLDPRYAGRSEAGYLCKVCDLALSSRRGLESHMGVSHPGLAVFRCNQCHRKFASDVGLILHIQNKHPPPGQPSLTCPEAGCPYTTHGRQLLRAHRRHHRLGRALQCPVCQKSLTGGDKAFRHHMALHTGERAFPCGHCGKTFVSQSRLTYHKTNVHDPPKFQCDQCSKLFRSKVNFTRHLAVHSAARPHTCPVCQAAFRAAGQLTAHVQAVHAMPGFTAGREAREAREERVLGRAGGEPGDAGRREAEGILAAAPGRPSIEGMRVREAERRAARRRGKRKAEEKPFVPQIVTLTNEKGDLIKAIISVDGEKAGGARVRWGPGSTSAPRGPTDWSM